MKVTFEKVFPMPGPAGNTWLLLQDIQAVAGCLPGARITEQLDATHYKGTVAVKFGPAALSFRGELEVRELDGGTRTMRLIGTGTDTTGSSAASMDLTARVEAIDDTHSNVLGSSEVSMSGKAAAFGGRMVNAVADQVLKQFAANLATKVGALPLPPADGALAAPPAGDASAASTAAGESAGGGSAAATPDVAAPGATASGASDVPSAAAASGAAAASTTAASTTAASSASAAASTVASSTVASSASPTRPVPPASSASQAVAAEPAALDGFALFWAIVKDWLRGLFSARKA